MQVKGEILHIKQNDSYSCGAIALSVLLGISLEAAQRECKTTKTGTSMVNISAALSKRGVNNHLVQINKDWNECLEDLLANSFRFPMILDYSRRGRYFEKGRDKMNEHAIVLADGLAICGGKDSAIPIRVFSYSNTKSILVRQIIIVDCERPNYLRNWLDKN